MAEGGDDVINGGPGNDRISAGRGRDTIRVDGRGRDRVDCGPGVDHVVADRSDSLRNCEVVNGRASRRRSGR